VQDHEESIRALKVLEGPSGGRASFIPVSASGGWEGGEGDAGSLLEVVETPEDYRGLARSLLGNVRVVETLSDAVALWKRNGTRAITVTKSGELIDELGVLSGGSERPLEEALLARKREIRELRAEMETATRNAEETGERQRAAIQRVEELGRVHEESGTRLQSLRVECARGLKDEERLEEERKRLEVECEAAEMDLKTLEQEWKTALSELEALGGRLEEAKVGREAQEAALRECQAGLEEERGKAEHVREALAALSIEEANRGERQGRTAEVWQRTGERAEQIQGRLRELEQRCTGLDVEAQGLRADRATVEERHAATLAELTTSESEAAAAAEKAAGVAKDAARCEDQARERREALEECREERRGLEVDLAERRATRDHVVEGIREKYGRDVTQDKRVEEETEVAEETEQEAAIDERIEGLRARLARLGDVHVGCGLASRDWETYTSERSKNWRTCATVTSICPVSGTISSGQWMTSNEPYPS
jgi:chromosome segregation protein